MREVEIRSNILGDIGKIRHGVVFQSFATVIDELIQNAQRANASEVRVTLEGDSLIISDNGRGCEDPQYLFEKNTSAWGNVDEAFGEGFFSVFLLADWLRVESHNWAITIDVLEMFETGNLVFQPEETGTFFKGFKVHIKGERVAENYYDLETEIRTLGRITPENFVILFNNALVEKQPLLQKRHDGFSMIFNNELYEAMLYPSRFGTIDLFYEHRPVTYQYLQGVEGNLHLKKGAVNLKAPDRKELIWDKKRTAFIDQLTVDARTMYLEFIKGASDADLDRFADSIDRYVQVEDYVDLLRVDKNYKVMQEVAETLEQSNPDADPEEIQKILRVFYGMAQDLQKEDESQENQQSPVERTEPAHPRLKDVVSANKNLVWIRASEVEEYKNEIKDIEYYGFQIIVARNKLFERAFEFLNVQHIGSFKSSLVKDFVIAEDEPCSKKEARLLHLLKRVEKAYGLPENVFRIADIELKISYQGRHVGVAKVEEEKMVAGVCDFSKGTIALNRKLIDFSVMRTPSDIEHPAVLVGDYRVLLQVLNTVAHELAHYLPPFYKDNTQEHAQLTAQLNREIALLF